jgi:hypothetical protein
MEGENRVHILERHIGLCPVQSVRHVAGPYPNDATPTPSPLFSVM